MYLVLSVCLNHLMAAEYVHIWLTTVVCLYYVYIIRMWFPTCSHRPTDLVMLPRPIPSTLKFKAVSIGGESRSKIAETFNIYLPPPLTLPLFPVSVFSPINAPVLHIVALQIIHTLCTPNNTHLVYTPTCGRYLHSLRKYKLLQSSFPKKSLICIILKHYASHT